MTLHIPPQKLARCHCNAKWQTKYLKDAFYVPTIIKKLVLVGQMVEQGL